MIGCPHGKVIIDKITAKVGLPASTAERTYLYEESSKNSIRRLTNNAQLEYLGFGFLAGLADQATTDRYPEVLMADNREKSHCPAASA
jgi:hypothetical protein